MVIDPLEDVIENLKKTIMQLEEKVNEETERKSKLIQEKITLEGRVEEKKVELVEAMKGSENIVVVKEEKGKGKAKKKAKKPKGEEGSGDEKDTNETKQEVVYYDPVNYWLVFLCSSLPVLMAYAMMQGGFVPTF